MNLNGDSSKISSASIRKGGVRLLALDGGGVKGISSLVVLGAIMEQVKALEIEQEINNSENERLPKDYFELAGGTSTGGLITLMLFRLNMSVSQTIDQYNKLAAQVFSPTLFGFSLHRLGKVGDFVGRGVLPIKAVMSPAQFSDVPLKKAIDTVVQAYGQDESDIKLKGEAALLHPNAGKM